MRRFLRKSTGRLRYALRYRRGPLVVFMAVCLVYAVLRFTKSLPQASEQQWDFFDTMVKIATLVIALLLWVEDSYAGWLRSLDHRLFVTFRYDGKPVLRCDHAPLFTESDLRAYSQQIGAQMAGRRDLDFAIRFQHERYVVEDLSVSARAYLCHVSTFDLDAEPAPTAADSPVSPAVAVGASNPKGKEQPRKNADLQQLAELGICLYWHALDSSQWQPRHLQELPPLPARAPFQV